MSTDYTHKYSWEDVKDNLRNFTNLILHGDEVHKAWLLEAVEAFIDDRDLPPPRDKNGVKK